MIVSSLKRQATTVAHENSRISENAIEPPNTARAIEKIVFLIVKNIFLFLGDFANGLLR
jgi:hypothetical protein